MKRSVVAAIAAVCVLSFAAPAAWADPPDSPRPSGVSLTLSPLHLALPVAELTLELPLGESRKSGLALIAGYGSAQVRDPDDGEDDRQGIYELGASWRYYLIGHYSFGLQLGAELLYAGASEDVNDIAGIGREGFMGSVFLGFKIVLLSGFTIDLQGGAGYVVALQQDDGDSDRSDVAPLLNLNLGWTF